MVQRTAAYAIGRSPHSKSHLRSAVTELTECHPVFPSQFPSPNLVKVPSSSRAGLVTETQSSEKTKKGPPWTQLPLSCREHRNLSNLRALLKSSNVPLLQEVNWNNGNIFKTKRVQKQSKALNETPISEPDALSSSQSAMLWRTYSILLWSKSCADLIHSHAHWLQIPGFFSRRIPGMQCYLPQPDLLVPRSTAVLPKFVGRSRMNSWYSLIPVNTQKYL